MTAPHLTPLAWQGSALAPESPLAALDEDAHGAFTILHTNDFHSSIDMRPGYAQGGLARIASTIETTRAVGPTLVVDAGDSVFGGGTWWCATGASTTGRLMGVAGYQLGAIGNHDLEHGAQGLYELLEGGQCLVATNLTFDDAGLRERIAPAYVVSVDGLRIGVLGLTTTMTRRLVPRRMLEGIQFEPTLEILQRALAALSPLVHGIVILSHLGFDHDDGSDIHVIPWLRGSKVCAILGGHTHDALDPARVIDGIVTCNAGAHGINVNQVTLARTPLGSMEVRAGLVPQDVGIPESAGLLAAREAEVAAMQPLQMDQVRLPVLEISASRSLPSGVSKDREWALLTAALAASGQAPADGIQMVAYLYTLGQLPTAGRVSRLEILTAYPNAEHLVELSISGAHLKELIELQSRIVYYFAALPVWLDGGREVLASELEDQRTYSIVTTELAAEGGLDWTLLQNASVGVRSLGMTCAELVWRYLQNVEATDGMLLTGAAR